MLEQATVTIVHKNRPGPGKTMWELVAETGEKFKAFNSEAELFVEGNRYCINFEPREFKGFPFKQVKGAPKLLEPEFGVAPKYLGQESGPRPSDPGPYIGMWEKEVSRLKESGMADSDIIAHGVETRRLALIIARAKLDEPKRPVNDSQGIQKDPNDTLEF